MAASSGHDLERRTEGEVAQARVGSSVIRGAAIRARLARRASPERRRIPAVALRGTQRTADPIDGAAVAGCQ